MKKVSYSDGSVIHNPIIQIWDDNHCERSGFYRAFWCATKDSTSGSPVIGYCSPGGSQKTIRAAMYEALRFHPGTEVYRKGRLLNPVKESAT